LEIQEKEFTKDEAIDLLKKFYVIEKQYGFAYDSDYEKSKIYDYENKTRTNKRTFEILPRKTKNSTRKILRLLEARD